jgi:hypothetical protein
VVTRPTTQQKKAAMLAAYIEHGTVFHACRATSMSRRTHYDWLQQDPAYASAFEDAKDAVADRLEQEAARRAKEGWPEPVFYKGEVCGHVHKFSDLLLIFLLKGLRPEKYRERVDTRHEGTLTLEAAVMASREPEVPRA